MDRYGSWRLYVLLAIALCVGNMQGAVQPISGGMFDPPLRPTTNIDDTVSNHIYNRVIVEDATMTAVEINGILYKDIEGATNATMSGSDRYWPVNGTDPGSSAAAVCGLNLAGEFNRSPYYVMFSNTVTTATDGGFFLVEYGGNDANVYVYPLDSNGDQIEGWVLTIVSSAEWGDGRVLRPHGRFLAMGKGSGPVHEYVIGGLAFTLDDFTGGSGRLNNVKGLKIVNSGLDLMMAGIYRGTGESILYRSGRAVKMRDATFNVSVTNNMAGDFTLTGFSGASSITGPSNAYQFDTRADSHVIWPANGVQPTITNSLLGLDINGVQNLEYWDFMFAEAVTNAADGFFMLDENDNRETTLVFPLDANRRPISSYAVTVLQSPYQWNPLANSRLITWGGNLDNSDPLARIAGTVIPLGAFAGGSGSLTNVHGIRVYAYPLQWDGRKIDTLVVGSYKADPIPRPIYDAELDPMPSLPPDSDHIGYSGYYSNDWSVTAIILESGRYTDLEGPGVVNLNSSNWEYPSGSTNPPGSAAESALGLDSSGLMNCHNSYWYFDTTITNGFDGGFFLFDAARNHTKVEPLGTDSNVIAGFSMLIIQNRDFTEDLESAFAGTGSRWLRRYGNPPSSSTDLGRYLQGVSFTLDCFTNAAGESLTSDVTGVRLTNGTFDGNTHTIDTIMVGIYKGPAAPPVSGVSSPITGVTFSPPISDSSSYSNNADIASVQSVQSGSLSVRGPNSGDIYGFTTGGSVYYPIYGTDPGPFTNALAGLNVDGVIQTGVWTEYMFEQPINKGDDGFFIVEHGGQDLILVRPLGADRIPISTYVVQTDNSMFGRMGLSKSWILAGSTSSIPLTGTMIRLSDFAGGTGPLGDVYGIRIQEPQGQFDPAVVGMFDATPETGSMIMIQ